jgi:hypothetical protein
MTSGTSQTSQTSQDAVTESDPQRAFDFWIGSWEVFGPKGRQVGSNEITSVLGGSAIAEHWHGNGGVEGRSLNAYDAARDRWHQTWVDNGGSVLLLDGGPVAGSMVLEGVAPAEDDATRLDRQRITWTPSADRSEVRQHWEVSADDGATWQTAFDGYYRRRPEPAPSD